jgi:FAD/FMN-containing dehydrogenase
MIRPSCGVGCANQWTCFYQTVKQNIFARGLDDPISLRNQEKSSCRRNDIDRYRFAQLILRATRRANQQRHGQDFLSELGGPNRFQERSAFLTKSLNRSEIDVALDRLWKWAGSRDRTIQPDVRFFQTGGAINKADGALTAFVHRDSRWLMDIGLPWSSDDSSSAVTASREWLNQAFAALSKFGNGESYQNYADPSFNRDESSKAYYGTNLQKLREIKRNYDPDNLFRFDQSIQPAG